VGNTTGIYLDRTPVQRDRTVHLTGYVVALNEVALRLHSTERGVRFTGNDVHGNGAVVEVDGGGDALQLAVARNHWSDYAGFDLDRNGVGDVPFVVKLLSGDLVAGHPALKLLRGTLALGLVDAVARTVPVFASKLVLRDASPRMLPGPMRGLSLGEVPALSVAEGP
jgi:nitrous oxidase accessory protein